MYTEIAKRIANASKNHTLTFFVGAGVSRCSGIPGWGELIEKICKELGRPIPSKGFSSDEYLSIPQMFYYSISDKTRYCQLVKNAIDKPDARPNEIHKLMFSMKPASFLTTNYDSLLEIAAAQYCQPFKCVAVDEEVPTINGDRFILKVHGDFDHNNFVLKEEDYLQYEDSFKLIATMMRSVFSTNTVVFIGYRIGDYNVKLILDWVKRVLRDRFRAVFLHTDPSPLSDAERKYYESRGLDVVELSRVVPPSELAVISSSDYIVRYTRILEYLRNAAKQNLVGKDEEESFIALYNRVKALDKLEALRVFDLRKVLGGEIIVGDEGRIILSDEQKGLFAKFIRIYEMPIDERKRIGKKQIAIFRVIKRVLTKAGIVQIEYPKKKIVILPETGADIDIRCIDFDYAWMESYCKQVYTDIGARSKKAFYLTRLCKYEEAFEEFVSIAKDAFNKKDFVHFYIAEVNGIALKKILDNPIYYLYSDSKTKTSWGESQTWIDEDELFNSLPQEFKADYSSIRDLSSSEYLYKYGYEASVDAKNLEKTIANRTYEIGFTSSRRAFRRVNENLRFLLGNGICLDVFDEYKSTVCNLMEKLIRKLTNQISRPTNSNKILENQVVFDQYDFYCIIKTFSTDNLSFLLKSNGCKTIPFLNVAEIETAILNLLRYMERLNSKPVSTYTRRHFSIEASNVLSLARYMDLSTNTVEEICRYIFRPCFNMVTIDEKVLFIDAQVFSRKNTTPVIFNIIEQNLIAILDEHIEAVQNNESWDSLSKTAGINYPNLADYLGCFGEKYCSRRLTSRVDRIITQNIEKLQEEVVYHYAKYISRTQKKRLYSWIDEKLRKNFDYKSFSLLVNLDERAGKKYSEQLRLFLHSMIENQKEKRKNEWVKVLPEQKPYAGLVNVGYWCFCGYLNKKDFECFTGVEPEFDFLINPNSFDYSRFDVSWLMDMNDAALKKICKKATIKKKLIDRILQALKQGSFVDNDRKRLVDIMCNFLT